MGASLRDRAATPSEPSPAVSGIAGIPSAADELRKNAAALKSWMDSVREQIRSASDPMFGHGYPIEQRVNDALDIGFRLAASILHLAETTASAIETRSAETEGFGPKDESAPGRPESSTHQDRDNVK